MLRTVLAAVLLLQTSAVTFDANRAFEHLRQLVALGPRPAGSPAIAKARTYIKTQLAAAGIAVSEQPWVARTPIGPLPMVNLIASVPGASPDRVVIAGHYDTKRFNEFRFVGANDGGSSAAFLIELARVLKARSNPLTIELLFLDGEEAVIEWREEDHTYGSRHYVADAKRRGSLASLKAMILVDMIGDRDLRLKRDLNSTPWLTDVIWATARARNQPAFHSDVIEIEDDHLPFIAAGVPAVDLIDFEFPAWHGAGDTLDAVSADSLQVVADVLIAALPEIEARLARTGR